MRMSAALDDLRAPASADYYSAVTSIGMHLNSEWGCCTIAADANIVEQQTAYGQGTEVTVPDADVLTGYEVVGHFDPAAGGPGENPTDRGALVPDALAYLQKTGLAGHKIAYYGQVNPWSVGEIQLAIAEFGAVSTGVRLPQSAMSQFEAGAPDGESYPVWSVTADDGGIAGGHCVLLAGYDAAGFYLFTWGAVVHATYAWWSKYGMEAWPVISADWVNAATGRDPEGVDKDELGRQFAAVIGVNPFA